MKCTASLIPVKLIHYSSQAYSFPVCAMMRRENGNDIARNFKLDIRFKNNKLKTAPKIKFMTAESKFMKINASCNVSLTSSGSCHAIQLTILLYRPEWYYRKKKFAAMHFF